MEGLLLLSVVNEVFDTLLIPARFPDHILSWYLVAGLRPVSCRKRVSLEITSLDSCHCKIVVATQNKLIINAPLAVSVTHTYTNNIGSSFSIMYFWLISQNLGQTVKNKLM